ncbi:olfactomedin-4-like [Eucyclogobius newberryi]|uniref:olfactomedin-4-like n=1 Tax=Eucyclogobius newberryi TaxID=166745 RepID=UPI003B59BBD8
MKLHLLLLLCALSTLSLQSPTQSPDKCECELSSTHPFPRDKLNNTQKDAADCNNDVTPQKALELESLLLGLERRLPELVEDMSELEREDDGGMYGVLALHVIHNELHEIRLLMDRLNITVTTNRQQTQDTTQQISAIRAELQELETYDTQQVIKRDLINKRLKRDLDQCRTGQRPTDPPTAQELCPHGRFQNVSGPRINTAGEYPGSFKYGAWGRDPKPEEGKESWYWYVPLTASNRYAHYVRLYSSLSSLVVGVSVPGNVLIHSSNPTTNTVQGPNVVLYGGALYYNCYNMDAVCQFNLTSKTVTTLQLPKGTRFNSKSNFCHLDECYPFTDLDLATDESGVWVIYTTNQDHGNLVLSKVEDRPEGLVLGQTWHTSMYKQAVTNTFMACGVLYATRAVNKDTEEIFYSYDTTTGQEQFNIGIYFQKIFPNIYALNYSPVDQMLHAYCESNMVSYKVIFDRHGHV